MPVETVSTRPGCFFLLLPLGDPMTPRQFLQDLEDFRTGELAKAHADFKRQAGLSQEKL